ncbi:MAG: hypothetical protein JW969_18360 [Spirochaetales bacterium]|nr:hypothetical protein [Spirochaetales bacterium]
MSEIIDFTGLLDINGTFKTIDEGALISGLVNWSEKARREGLLALEDDLEEINLLFMRKLLQLVVDGTDPEIIKGIGRRDIAVLSFYTKRIYKALYYMVYDHDEKNFAKKFGSRLDSLRLTNYRSLFDVLEKQIWAKETGNNDLDDMNRLIVSNMGLDEKGPLLNDCFKTCLAVNRIRYKLVLKGCLSIQSGDNPRIVEAALLCFADPLKRDSYSMSE